MMSPMTDDEVCALIRRETIAAAAGIDPAVDEGWAKRILKRLVRYDREQRRRARMRRKQRRGWA